MARDGTVVNGVIVFDGSPPLPDGTRVRVEVAGDDGVAPPTDTYAEHLAKLRQSVEAQRAGARGKPIAELAAELRREYGVPPKCGG